MLCYRKARKGALGIAGVGGEETVKALVDPSGFIVYPSCLQLKGTGLSELYGPLQTLGSDERLTLST